MKKEEQTKIAVITGASSGIGKVMRESFVKYGYRVICVSRTKPEDCAEEDFFACDLSDEAQTESTARKIGERVGRVDLLVNNAGLGVSGATELIPMQSVRYVTEVNYFAPLVFTRTLIPYIPRGGKIVMISSACALFALPYRSIYCSDKAALNMLSFGLRMELRKSGITVTAICPGDIKSNFTANRIKYTDTNERYGGSVANSQNKIDSREDKRMDVNNAGRKIAEIAQKKKGAMYIVGAKYKFLYFMSKILPQSLMLKATGKMFNK